jgi:hypothetical protein
MDGSVDRSTSRVTGTVTDPTFGWTGTFQGSMFGPDGAEMAITFRAMKPSGEIVVGDFIGKRRQ